MPGARAARPDAFMTGAGLPSDRETRVRTALAAAVEALRLARREAEGGATDRARLAWVALGMISALKGALVAALSSYDTAEVAAVMDPSDASRLAPVTLLLRRARSADYLNLPERLSLSAGQMKAVERVISVRNAAVHALPVAVAESFSVDTQVVADIVRRLLDGTSAGSPAQMAFADVELEALKAALVQIKPA